MGIVKNRCVCEICSCGKHACTSDHKNTVGKLRLKNEGDIYVAPSAAFQFPDNLNLFEGAQDNTTIVREDFQGSKQKFMGRHHPEDLIKIPNAKMSAETITLGDYTAYEGPLIVKAEEVKQVKAAPADKLPAYKMNEIGTSYDNHFPAKTVARTVAKEYKDEMPKQGGDLDFKTLNKVDYLKNVYGRPVINKIDDSNIFNIDHSVPSGKPNKDPSAGYVPVSALTTNNQCFPGHRPERQKDSREAKREGLASDNIKFGPDDAKAKLSTYAGVYTGPVQSPRKSKRRDTAVNFGTEFTKDTSYGASFEKKNAGYTSPARKSDSLNLFEGDQDNTTIVREDFQNKRNLDIERRKPKDQIEFSNNKMSADTITLGSYQPPKLEESKWGTVKSVPDEGAGGRKAFDLEDLPHHKMASHTSYGAHFPKKQAEKVKQNIAKEEMAPSSGDLDFATLNKMDYLANTYGRPIINKIPDNNVMGVDFTTKMRVPVSAGSMKMMEEDIGMDEEIMVDMGRVKSVQAAPMMDSVSVPSSRGSSMGIKVEEEYIVAVKNAPGYIKMGDRSTTHTAFPDHMQGARRAALRNQDNDITFGDYSGPKKATYDDYAGVRVAPRSSKKKGTTIDFGPQFYGDTSYGGEFTSKKCLVPSLNALDEYTFKGMEGGHRVYRIDCGCPPKGAASGACGCPPPPAVKA